MADTFELGRAIGGAMNPQEMGGQSGTLARQIALKQFGSQLSYRNDIKKELIKNGIGISISNGEVQVSQDYSPEEAMLALKGFENTQMKALENEDKKNQYKGRLFGYAQDMILKSSGKSSGYKGEQKIEIEKSTIQRSMQQFEKVYGKPMQEVLGVDPLEEYDRGTSLKDAFDLANKFGISKAYSSIQQKKDKSTSTDHLNYSQMYFMLKPEDREGWTDPKELIKQFPPKDMVDVSMSIKRKEKDLEDEFAQRRENRATDNSLFLADAAAERESNKKEGGKTKEEVKVDAMYKIGETQIKTSLGLAGNNVSWDASRQKIFDTKMKTYHDILSSVPPERLNPRIVRKVTDFVMDAENRKYAKYSEIGTNDKGMMVGKLKATGKWEILR